jgi:hypothetical protein
MSIREENSVGSAVPVAAQVYKHESVLSFIVEWNDLFLDSYAVRDLDIRIHDLKLAVNAPKR